MTLDEKVTAILSISMLGMIGILALLVHLHLDDK